MKWREKFDHGLDEQPSLLLILMILGVLLTFMCLNWKDWPNNVVGLLCGFILGVAVLYSLVLFDGTGETPPAVPAPVPNKEGGKKP